jgi:superfamily II DNA or RNA helicase
VLVNSTLRPDQTRALDLLSESLASGKRRPLIQAPTGWGKTVLATAIAHHALTRDQRIVFVAPALSLIDQTVDRFYTEGITEIGVIQANHPMTNGARRVQIASAQTLGRRLRPLADIVVVDEAHRLHRCILKWMTDADWRHVPFIGLSATPWTRGLGRYYDHLIIASATRERIDAGHLSPFRVFAPSHPDLSGVRTVAGDYHEGDLGMAMNKAPLVADIVTTWLERGQDRPTICFAVNCAHAQALHQQFEVAGITTDYIDAYTDRMEREKIKLKFHAGLVRVVVNVGCLTTGIDWDVRCIILARPTKSEMLYVQMIGRGLRTAQGKTNCLILDHSDTTMRLGFVTDIHHDQLDDGRERQSSKRDRSPPLPSPCPSCAFLRPAKVHVCPACGFAPERRSDIKPVDGELMEVTPRGTPAPYSERQRWFSGLLYIAERRDYKQGWAAYKFKERFGFWPDAMLKEPRPPATDIVNWVKSRQIAWAKARRAA